MEYHKNQEFFLTDRRDDKPYPVKVLNVDKEKRELKVHYVGWSSTLDEVIPFDSDRIYLEHEEAEEDDDTFCSAQEVGNIGAAIGRLLMAMDAESKKVVSAYDVRLSFGSNCKNFGNKYKVPQLEQCADNLKIKIMEEGKKVFTKNKAGLVAAIVRKIESHLPHNCRNCSNEYSLKLGDDPLFLCHKCGVPSHDCEEVLKIKNAFPEALPGGLVWMCGDCNLAPTQDYKTQTDDETNVCSKSLDETKADHEKTPRAVEKPRENEPEKNQNKKILCKHYVWKKCRHGSKGIGCSFDHPKKCFKFLKNGSVAKHGCNKGKNCQYFHPPLCRTSVKNGVCANTDCHFHHLKGTKFTDGIETEVTQRGRKGVSSHQKSRTLPQMKSRAPSAMTPPIHILQRPSYANVVAPDDTGLQRALHQNEQNASNSQNFLELNWQIQQIVKAQIEKMLKMNSSQLTETKSCRCQMMCQ